MIICRNKVVFLAFSACLIFVIVFLLPKIVRVENLSFSSAIGVASARFDEEPESNKIKLERIDKVMVEFLQHFSAQLDEPLFLLDNELTNCLTQLASCVVDAMRARKYIIFGVFNKLSLAGGQNTSNLTTFPIKDWTVVQFKESNVILLHQTTKIQVLLVYVNVKEDYWIFDSVPELNVTLSALIKPKEIATVGIGANQAQLSLPNWSHKLMNHEFSSMQLLSCNDTLANSVKLKYPQYYGSNKQVINNSIVADLAYMRNLLLSIDLPVFLLGGTLLGWYRECGIIPYTTDMDVSARITDYNDKLESLLVNDKRLQIYWKLGKPEDSLEYSVYAGPTKFDVFFLYETPTEPNKSWVGGMIVSSKTKLRWSYPKLSKICSAILNNFLFHVPCDVESFLKADYGPEWHVPFHEQTFVWYQSHHNIKQAGHWSAEEWHQVYKKY